jgi:hypothetical protein
MKKLVSLSFAWILFFATQIWAATWDQRLPMQTTEDKAEAFLKIRAMIPSIADGAARYGFDPITLFNHQLTIEQMVQADAEYRSLRPSHHDLIELAIFDGNAQPTGDAAKESNWKAWQERSAQLVSSWGLQSAAEVTTEIQKILQSPLLGKTQGIVVGLSNLVPGPMKKEFFSANISTKIEILKQHLPSEVISHGFAPTKLGWTDTEISKDEIIRRLQAASDMEQRLTVLLVNDYSQSTHLAEPKDYLNKWTLEANQKKSLDQWFNTNVAKMIPTEGPKAEASLILREIPPSVAIFRGFAGNDCSTKFSFPFVNSPNEFTFLIYDSKGGIKGYAQGTRVLVNGLSTFYLHTIAGPRVSKVDALNVIKTFVQEKKSLGFNDVLLPPLAQVKSLNNFLPVVEAIQEVLTSSERPLQYQDAELRSTLKSTFSITSKYDDAANNPLGHEIDQRKLGNDLKIVRKEAPGLDKISTQIDKNSLIGVLLIMGQSFEKNETMIKTLAPHAGIPVETVLGLINLAKNDENRSSTEFTETFERSIQEAGFSFKEGHFKKNLSWLAKGLLNSPDTIGNQALSESVVLSLVEQRELKIVESFLLKNPNLFSSDALTVGVLKAFYIDIHEASFIEPMVLAAALNVNPRAILQNSSLLEILVGAPKAVSAITDFLELNPRWAQAMDKKAAGPVLELQKKRAIAVESVLQKANAARDGRAYINALEQLKTMSGFTAQSRSIHLKNLRMQTVDHLLKVGSGEPLTSELRAFYGSKPNLADPAVLQTLLKLLPAALRSADWQLDGVLKIAAELRDLPNAPANLDTIIASALSERTDSKTKKLQDKVSKKIPGINLNQATVVRCEAIFH